MEMEQTSRWRRPPKNAFFRSRSLQKHPSESTLRIFLRSAPSCTYTIVQLVEFVRPQRPY
jgi:hypothetical protein